jgi:hypothetical protein
VVGKKNMDQNTNIEPRAGFFSKSYLKHIAAFLGLILLVGGSYFVWDGYFSEGAKYRRQVEENMTKYTEWEKNYNKAMTEDVYGGKTPQETLDMFIDALRKGDVDLASKYFMLNSVGRVNQESVEGLKKIKEENRIVSVVEVIAKLNFDKIHSSADTAWFTFLNSEGIVEYSAILKLNEFSKVWKIESL